MGLHQGLQFFMGLFLREHTTNLCQPKDRPDNRMPMHKSKHMLEYEL